MFLILQLIVSPGGGSVTYDPFHQTIEDVITDADDARSLSAFNADGTDGIGFHAHTHNSDVQTHFDSLFDGPGRSVEGQVTQVVNTIVTNSIAIGNGYTIRLADIGSRTLADAAVTIGTKAGLYFGLSQEHALCTCD